MRIFKSIGDRILDLPIKKKLYLIIGLLIGNIVLVISLGTFALNTLASIRTAVAGESMWAKAQKTAVFSLSRYALSRDEKDYRNYLEAMKVPIAYEPANRELQKPHPDLARLDEAFIKGGIDPKDVRGLDHLFIYFGHFPHVDKAFAAWGDAQRLMDQVKRVGERLHASHLSLTGTKEEQVSFESQIDRLNREITAQEITFSTELGEASRLATHVFLWMMIGGSLFIGLSSVGIAFFITNAVAVGVEKISKAASQVASGDLRVRVAVDTKDELGRLGRAFNHMTDGLGKLDILKTEFFANVSHEFRTPLTLLLGPLEDLLSSPEKSRVHASLEIVYRNALRLLKLVNSLLDFSRLEAGKLKAIFAPTDLSAYTIELASHFATAMEKAGLEYIVDCEASPQNLYVDRDLWEKIVFNLLSNALKFTFSGSVKLRLRYDASGARLEVEDTGAGIASAELPHLFERFHRIQGVRSRTHEGSGIGLSLVQELTSLHGGSVEARSEEGKGSTFSATIPFGSSHLPEEQVSQKAPAMLVTDRSVTAYVQEAELWLPDEPAAPAAPDSPSGEKPRILVVDDNADMRAYIARLLSPQWEVLLACNGVEALDCIRDQPPDLVLSDIMMPQLDGFQLLEHIRKTPSKRHISIILLSARAGEESRSEGIMAGADDYLVKPFSAKELIARVNTHLTLSRVRKEAAINAAVISRLEDEKKWLQSALNLMPIPLLLVDPASGNVTFANHSADTMAGGVFPTNVPAEEITTVYKLTDTKDRVLPIEEFPFAKAARKGKITGEIIVWHAPAGRFTLMVSADALTEMHNHPRTILMALQDVGPLLKAVQLRDEFLSIASHELRTPITSLRMQLQLAQRELNPEKGIIPSPERLAKLIQMFGSQTERLKSLVEDLLDVTRIQSGKLSLNPEACDLSELIKRSIERLSPNLAEAQCSLDLHIEEGVVGKWDAKRIEQVVTNLLVNATKYAPGKPVRVSLTTKNGRALLMVQDFGPGIPKETQSKIFERFERAASPRNISGLGLGLFLSRQIVKAHSGSIELFSDTGKGCLFTVTLPLDLPPQRTGDVAANLREVPPELFLVTGGVHV